MATKNQIAYGLDNPLQSVFPKPVESRRAPKTSDHYQIGQVWVDVTTNTAYMLTSIAANASQWTNLVGGSGVFASLEATTGNITADVGDVVVTAGTVQIATLADTMLIADAAGNIVSPGTATDGEILIGSTGLAPVLATLTSGAGINITNGAGSITISALATNVTWTVETVDQVMSPNHGYICNKAGLVTLTLPATAAIGDTYYVTCKNVAAGWKIAQNAGQTLHGGTADSTTGVAGYAASTAKYDTAMVVCITTDTDFVIIPMMGSIDVA